MEYGKAHLGIFALEERSCFSMIVPFNIGLSPRGNTHLHDLRAAILVASCKRWAQSQPQWGFTTIPLFCGNEVIYVRGQRNEKPLVMPVVYEQLGRYQISVCIASLNATQFVIRRSLRLSLPQSTYHTKSTSEPGNIYRTDFKTLTISS